MSEKKGVYGIWLVILGIAILLGLYTALKLFTQGHALFNTNDVIIWSLPLGVYIFLALTSSGLTLLAGMPLMLKIKKYEPFAKRLVFLSAATLMGAFVAIGLELGSVEHMFWYLFSPNLSSPIWWMGLIYIVELVVLSVKFWRMHTGDWHSGFSNALGVISFLLAIIAPLMIGSIFGITESRVTYFGPMMSIYSLVLGLLSGTALFLLYNIIFDRISGDDAVERQAPLYNEFTVLFGYVAGITIVLSILKFVIESATTVPEFLVYHKFEHAFGAWQGFHLEVLLGLFLPFVLLLIPSVRRSIGGKIVTSALILVGTLMMHMEILLAGQSHPVGPKAEQYPEFISYFPSIWEWLVFVFALSVMLLLYTLGERYLKLAEVPQ
ncbi:MAG: polysulfide reductase NrfD [Deltaproteobacteria bacterium]|jgi:molybdopterin-containing oxidoreductase family membrane subunit|nr:polysulfide reductase NrfD [Deltaproteobacteria bacterium]